MFVGIFALVVFALGLIIAVGVGISEGYEWDSVLIGSMAGLVSALVAFVVAVGVYAGLLGLGHAIYGATTETTRYDLVALRDDIGFHQNAGFLGGGSGHSTGQYVFYYQGRDGAKQLVNINGSEVKLYEDVTDGKPYAIRESGCRINASWYSSECFDDPSDWIEIHVPAGSVPQYVNLTLGADE